MFDLTNRKAVVTGGNRGLGHAITKSLIAAGVQVTIVSRSSTGAEAAKALGASWLGADLSKSDEARDVVKRATASMGGLDILVNNAGQTDRTPALEVTDAVWEQLFAVNVRGVFQCAVEAATQMRTTGGGKIINIASGAWRVGLPGRSVYCSTKAAVVQMSRVLAMEWAPMGIQVNAIAPGFVRTDLNASYLDANPVVAQRLLRRIPSARLGKPEDIAAAVTFLASREASYITGQVLEIDGGLGLGVDLSTD